MASKYDVEPGTFESISGDSIGTFVLDEWTHFKLDGEFKFLVADPIIKQGVSTVPGSAYELATDADATAQEVGLTDATLYGMIRITNVTYVGVELNFTGKNYGTYGSNEAVLVHVAASISGKSEPGSDAFIEEGEVVRFADDTGIPLVSDNSGEITLWDSGTVYNVAGTLARLEGITAAASGAGSNQNKNPLLVVNAPFWFVPPDEDEMIAIANRGEVVPGAMHDVNDRAGGNYQQTMVIGKKEISATQYEFHMVHLDGSVVTGNTTLEAIFDVGGGAEYPYLDIYAPDVAGTRTLLDMGGRTTRAQSVSGKADTIGELQEDKLQRTTGEYSLIERSGGTLTSAELGVFTKVGGGGGSRTSKLDQSTVSSYNETLIEFDSANSVSPNAAKTDDDETRMANMVEGASYLITMQTA